MPLLAGMSAKGNKSEFVLYVVDQVRKLRTEANMSQSELAFKLDVSLGFIGKIESPNYTTKYSLDQINQLAKIFGCSVKDFFPDIPL
jgi:transcriptional regulator with XRE-family HTH domain